MNDVDASRLHQLSYAFQRRFNIIRVDTPTSQDILGLISERLPTVGKLKDANRRLYSFVNIKTLNSTLTKKLESLFANKNETDLIELGVVGVAQIFDIIHFVIEGLTTDSNQKVSKTEEDWKKLSMKSHVGHQATHNNLIDSYIAIGVTLSVYPQVMAFTG